MKFEIGKDYVTRDGVRRRVVAIQKNGDLVTILVDDESGDVLCIFIIYGGDGKIDRNVERGSDLISEWVEPVKPVEFWANVYVSSVYGDTPFEYTVDSYQTKQEAEAASNHMTKRTAKFREVIE